MADKDRRTFLQEVAWYIYENQKDSISDYNLVFPNRRAAVFFSKYLSEIIDAPIWSPGYLTISDLMFDISAYSRADQVELLFILYEVFRSHMTRLESFDDFYALGEVLINDFDDVDKHLVDARDLFTNLSSLKDIEDHFEYLTPEQMDFIRSFWSHFDAQSADQEKFASLWEALAPLYLGFKDRLARSGRVYEGMANRKVVEMIRKGWEPGKDSGRYGIVGFNAFTPSESILMDALKNAGCADFFWDYDPAYVFDDPVHEAGFFLRKNLKRFPPPPRFRAPQAGMRNPRHLRIISAPGDTGQVKMMSRTLRELKDLNRVARNNTALVLSDEHLLSQVMHSIPEDYADINITMGYPLIHTPAFSLVQALVDLQMRRKDSDGQPLYYFQDVLRILEHQYFSGMEDAELHDRIHQIKSGNQIFPSQSFLSVNEMTGTLFRPVATAPEMIEYLRDILLGALPEDQGQQEDADPRKDLQKEFIYHLYLTVNRLGDLMQRTMPDMGLDVLLRLLKKMLRGVTIPFLGEPLRGLQVMGILETRVLDFENLVILSMNEGIFPKAAPGMTMIPYNLRKGFGLPTPEHQDRLFAYYFYRLMHHAQNITFIYNSRADGLRTGEMSRFLYQLKYLYGWPISFQSLATSIRHIPDRIIEVAKGVEEMGLLNAYTERGEAILTPSALNHYLDCSLRFYFRYLAGLKEPEEVSEEPDQAVFGNLLHYTMEKLLSDAPDGTVTEPFIQELLTSGSRVRASIEEAMTRIWPEEKGPTSSGRFYIIREILFRYIGQVLKHDLQWVPFKILGLEQRITMPYEIKGPSDTLHIKLGGIIDRIDRVGNAIRIIDYKTGSVEKSIGTIDALFTRGSQNRRREGFQTFVYSWMVSVNRAHNEAVKPGLYDVRNMNSDQFRPEFTMQRKPILDLRPYFSDIEVALVDLLKEIFNPDLPFAQVADRKVCEWCPYQRICKRD